MWLGCAKIFGGVGYNAGQVDKQNSYPGGYLATANVKITLNYVNYAVEPGVAGTISCDRGEAVELPTPVRKGYTFNGWFTSQDCAEGTEAPIVNGKYAPTASVTLWAGWTQQTYTISYVLGDGGENAPTT